MSNPDSTTYSLVKQDFEEIMKSPKLMYYDNIVLCCVNDIFVPRNCDKSIHPFKASNMQTCLLLYGDTLNTILNEHSLVIDCCSLSSYHNSVDVCIGVKDDWSRPSDLVVGLVEEGFKRHGYRVKVNELYPKSMPPVLDIKYSSMMIAMSKHLNTNGRTHDVAGEANKLRQTLVEIYGVILSHSELI